MPIILPKNMSLPSGVNVASNITREVIERANELLGDIQTGSVGNSHALLQKELDKELPRSVRLNAIYRLLLTMYVMYKFNYTASRLKFYCNDPSYLAVESGIYFKFVHIGFTGTEFKITLSGNSRDGKTTTAVMTIKELEYILCTQASLLAMKNWLSKHFNNKK